MPSFIIKILFILTVFFPWLLLTSLLIIFTLGINKKSIFFIQARGGINHKKIYIFKFRTIYNNKINNFNKFLRISKLDELPQFLNILKGDINFIGPRPLLYSYKKLYGKKYFKRFVIKPGLTGLAQINDSKNLSFKKKFYLDLWYINNRSFYLDFKIIIITLKNLFLNLLKLNQKHVIIKKFNGKN